MKSGTSVPRKHLIGDVNLSWDTGNVVPSTTLAWRNNVKQKYASKMDTTEYECAVTINVISWKVLLKIKISST